MVPRTASFYFVFGLVDSPEKAALRVWLLGWELEWYEEEEQGWHGAQARRAQEGFEVWGMHEHWPCGPTDNIWKERVLLSVDVNGTVTEGERVEFDRSSNNCRPLGRRPEGLMDSTFGVGVGDYFARAAYLEAGSTWAFERMARELKEFGAPESLCLRATLAANDERRHSRAMATLARRFGAQTKSVRVARSQRRSLEAFALENAAEGCVFETFAAATALFQADHAYDCEIRATMKRVAQRDSISRSSEPDFTQRWLGEPVGASAEALARGVESLSYVRERA
jgi:hypothetical protein